MSQRKFPRQREALFRCSGDLPDGHGLRGHRRRASARGHRRAGIGETRPFLYAIVDDDTGAVLLVGRYSQREHAARAHGASGNPGGGQTIP
jgi:hypothetical protein